MRPGAQRRGKVIKLPLMYIGRESLTGVQVAVGSDRHEHIVSLNTEGGGPPYHQWEKLGDLAPGDEFWITILTKDVTGNLTFGLEIRGQQGATSSPTSVCRELAVRPPCRPACL